MSVDIIYMDYAAATPVDPDVMAAMQPYFSSQFYNPSASYMAAKRVHRALDEARATVAACLGARPSEVIFTAGGTESNNLTIHGVMRRYPDANIVVSAIEHESVLVPAKVYEHKLAAVHPDGRLDLSALERAIDDQTVLVSVMYANNEVGTIQPIAEVGRLISEVRRSRERKGNDLPIYLHSDACQAGNYLDLHVNRLKVDMLTINGGKLYGPKQSGVLYLKAGIELQPLILGGGQERNLRSGTENVANCVGLAAALHQAQSGRQAETRRLEDLRQLFIKLVAEKLPSVRINGSQKFRLANNVHLTFPGQDNERLLFALDEIGILAAAGSACKASSQEPSHVLKAMGIGEADAQASLRFTLGRDSDEAAVQRVVDSILAIG